jgi:hypothetical protein
MFALDARARREFSREVLPLASRSRPCRGLIDPAREPTWLCDGEAALDWLIEY